MRKKLTIAQSEKREGQDPRDDIPNGLDGKQVPITGIKQGHAKSYRANSGIQKLADANEDYTERYQQSRKGSDCNGPIYPAGNVLIHPNLSRCLLSGVGHSEVARCFSICHTVIT